MFQIPGVSGTWCLPPVVLASRLFPACFQLFDWLLLEGCCVNKSINAACSLLIGHLFGLCDLGSEAEKTKHTQEDVI